MKFSKSISLALAPVALAKSVRNKYPVRRDPNVGGVGVLGGAPVIQQTEVIVLLWNFPGGPSAQTTTLGQPAIVTQTVAVPPGGAPSAIAGLDGVTTTVQPGSTGVIAGTGATHSVTVGGPQGTQFFPQEIQANMGDTVVFEFLSQNHSVTQSTFDAPCDLLAGGMDSDYMANPNNSVVPAPQVAMQVMTLEPLWMFCKQGNHCGQGMTFSINPTAEKTHALFQANAIAQKGQNLQGTALTGGPGVVAPPAGAPPAGAPPAPAGSIDPNVSFDPLASPTIASAGFQATPGVVGGAIGGGNGLVQGVGQLQADGSCMCMVQCGGGGVAAAFPDAQQGIGAFGGSGGAISMDAATGIVAAANPIQTVA